MKNAYPIFTKTRLGLDVRVWLTLLFVGVISVAALSFKMATNVSCEDFSISYGAANASQGSSYYIGETVVFKISSKATNVKWDFGNNLKAEGNSVKHSFFQPGNYQVSATVNGKCSQFTNVLIRQFYVPKASSPNDAAQNPISGPDAASAGQQVSFLCIVRAGSYQWTVENSPNFKIQNTVNATFNFPSPGNKTIELKLDNNPQKVYRKTIIVVATNNNVQNAAPIVTPPVVMPKQKPVAQPSTTQPAAPSVQQQPVATQPAVVTPPPVNTKKALYAPDQEFQTRFEEVIQGSMDASGFNDILCNGGGTKVFTSDGGLETVASFCGKIHGNKKYRINSVKVDRDGKGCVTDIHIDYKKKGGFL